MPSIDVHGKAKDMDGGEKQWSQLRKEALFITLAYGAASIAWVLFSDKLLQGWATDNRILTEYQTFKGVGYILFASSWLYFLLIRGIKRHLRMEAQHQEERDRLTRLEAVVQTVRTLQHEVNNPLQALTGTLELLERRMGEDAEAHRTHLRRLDEASGRIQKVVSQLSQITEVETVPGPTGDQIRLPDPPEIA